MKRSIRWAWLAFVVGIVVTTTLPPAWAANPAAAQAGSVGYLENVVFERLSGKERVILEVTKQSGVTVEKQPGNAVLVRLKNLFVTEDLRRPLNDPAMANILRVTPAPKSGEDLSWAVAIELRRMVPYSVRQQGMNVLIDFNVTSLPPAPSAPEGTQTAVQPQAAQQAKSPDGQPAAPGKDAAGEAKKEKKLPKISIDVQNADIKAVLRLLSEQGKVSIVSGDDVKGEVTLNVKDVTWEEALDVILRVKNLEKVQEGAVITVLTLENLAKQRALEKSRREVEPLVTKVISIRYASADKLKENLQEFLKDKDGKPRGSVRVDEHSNSLIVQAVPDDISRIIPIIEKIDKPTSQVLIKANIVETTKDFARNLGIEWGGVFGRTVGNQSMYITPGGSGGSAVAPGYIFSGVDPVSSTAGYIPSSGVSGISGQGMAASLPAAPISGTNPVSLGLILGTIGGNVLELQLSALQRDNKINILSSPSISTLDNQKAVTENGMKVPVTTTDKDGNPSTRYEEAILQLEIVPHIIDSNTLKMNITIKKDEVSSTVDRFGNPYIYKKLTNTSLIVRDGETIVISGLSKQDTTGGDTGIPGLKDIPILGWLFKSDSRSSNMEEVLIFITPNILKQQALSGIQEGPAEAAEKAPATAVR